LKEAGAFARQVKATFPVLHDPSDAVFKKYGVSAIPANVVIDRKGKVVFTVEGADIKAIDAAIVKALRK
jgi:peroxiredoxin